MSPRARWVQLHRRGIVLEDRVPVRAWAMSGLSMRLPEFIEAAESYGVKVSRNMTNMNATRRFWEPILGPMPPLGQGYQRDYTPRMVRRLVAWSLVGEITGSNADSHNAASPQRRQATRLLAAASEGWVVLSEGRAFWSLVPPIAALKRGAVAIRVPEWRH